MTACVDYVRDLEENGAISFTMAEIVEAVGESEAVVEDRLRGLKDEVRIAEPVKGFHVVVPPVYRRLGCLPPDDFIPNLMKYLETPYYVALLSAGMYHRAAHQKPKFFQVMTPNLQGKFRCKGVHVEFIARSDMRDTPIWRPELYEDVLRVASPEATALEIVGYPLEAAGFSNVATVLIELGEKIDGDALEAEALRSPVEWRQRLGYLWEFTGWGEFAERIGNTLAEAKPAVIPLAPYNAWGDGCLDERWSLVVNTHVDPDIDIRGCESEYVRAGGDRE